MTRHRAAGPPSSRPRVALLIETSLASGRDILRGIAGYLREHEPWALYHEPHGLTDSVPSWLRRWRGDGIIARIQTGAMAQAIRATRIPTIDVLGVVPDLPFPLVHVDNTAIARMAANHLLDRGLRQFGYFGIEGENWSAQRYAGLCAAVQAEVPKYELPRDASGRRSWERIQNRLARWIAGLPKPAGILVCSDQRGPQFLEACRRASVVVPDEVAVISVDNDEPLCEVCNPALSSIQAGHTTVGYQAAAALDALMRSGRAPEKPLLIKPQQAITRLSSDMLAIDDGALAAALSLIRERAHEGLTVDAIVRQVGLSRSVLQRRFRARLKRSLHQEIVAARIRRAEELLLKTDLPLTAVAERAGFNYQEYMGAVFKAHLGKTPASIRRERR
jgi:LacI family transcriptional regulator